jgi:hypothetical protein
MIKPIFLVSLCLMFSSCKAQKKNKSDLPQAAADGKPFKGLDLKKQEDCTPASDGVWDSAPKVTSSRFTFQVVGSEQKYKVTHETFAGADCKDGEKIAETKYEAALELPAGDVVTFTGIPVVSRVTSRTAQCFRESEVEFLNTMYDWKLKDCKEPVKLEFGEEEQNPQQGWLKLEENSLLVCTAQEGCDKKQSLEMGTLVFPLP